MQTTRPNSTNIASVSVGEIQGPFLDFFAAVTINPRGLGPYSRDLHRALAALDHRLIVKHQAIETTPPSHAYLKALGFFATLYPQYRPLSDNLGKIGAASVAMRHRDPVYQDGSLTVMRSALFSAPRDTLGQPIGAFTKKLSPLFTEIACQAPAMATKREALTLATQARSGPPELSEAELGLLKTAEEDVAKSFSTENIKANPATIAARLFHPHLLLRSASAARSCQELKLER